MRFRENAFREPGPFAAPSTAALAFHRTLPGYEPTPLVDCQALADSLRALIADMEPAAV